MNDLPRQKLCELIAKYGESLCDEPLRLEGLLRDLCGKYRLEINLFTSALKEGIATDLRSSSALDHPGLVIARLSKRLQDHHAISQEAARWVVESWALALGKIALKDLTQKQATITSRPPAAISGQTVPQASRSRAREMAPSGMSFQQPIYVEERARAVYPPRKRGKVWLFVLLTAILLCLGGGGAWYFKLFQIPKFTISPPPKPSPPEVAAQKGEPEAELPPAAVKPVRPLPPNAKASFDKAVAAGAVGEWSLAAKYFGEARKGAPYSDEILFRLAEAESKIPDHEMRALTWFKAYLAAAPNGDKASEARSQITKLEVNIEGTIRRLIGQAKQMATQGSSTASDLDNVAVAQARTGDISGALQTANQISDSEKVYKSSAYQGIAQVQAEAGDFSGAQSTAYQITYPDYFCGAMIALAREQAKAGKLTDAQAALVSAKERRLSYHNSQTDKTMDTQTCAYTLSGVGTAQAELGDIDAAQQTANAIPGGPYPTWDKNRNIEKAVNGAKGSIRAAIGQALIKQAKEKSGGLQGARQVALSIADPSSKAGALHDLISQDIEHKDFADAENLIEQIADKEYWKPICYDSVINALRQANRVAEARQLLFKASSKFNQLNSGSVGYLINDAINLEEFDTAKSMLAVLKPDQRKNYMDSYWTAYANAKVKAGDLSAAKGSIQEITSDYSKSSVVETIIGAQLRKGDVSAALQTVGLLTKDDYSSIDAIVKAQLQKGDVSATLQTVGLLRDTDNRARSQSGIVDYLATNRQFTEAEKVAQRMQDAKQRDAAYQTVAQRLTYVGQFTEAERIAELINNVAERAKLYCTIASYQDSVGYRGKGLANLKRAAELSTNVTDPSDKAGCYSIVASYYRSEGVLSEAQQNISLARAAALAVADPAKRFSALDGLSYTEDACLTPAEIKKSEALLFDTIGLIDESGQKSSPYLSVARRLANTGDVAGAKEIREAMSPTDSYRDSISQTIGEVQAQRGNIRAAEQTATQLKEGSTRDDVYYYLIQEQIRRDDLRSAERVWGNMSEKSYYKGILAVRLATAYLKKNDLSGAKRCTDAVADPSKLLDGTFFEQVVKVGQIEWGKQLIAKAEAKLAKDSWSDWYSLATAKTKVGDLEGAKKIVPLFPASYESTKLYVCKGLAEAGEIEWAKQIAAQFKGVEQQADLSLAIAKGQVKNGDKEGAEKTLNELTKRQLTTSQLISAAAVRNTVAGLAAARQTLALVHPSDADFEGWADYQIAGYTEEAAAAKKIADGIKETNWKSRAYRSVMGKENNIAAKEAIAAAIPDTFQKSEAYRDLITKAIEDGDWSKALQQANLVPVADLKLVALRQVLAAALIREELGFAEKMLQGLPDNESKTYMAMITAKTAAILAKKDVFSRCILLAQKSVETMPDGFWKARAFDEIATIATSANDPKLSQSASNKALKIASKLEGEERQNWENHLFARLPSPEEAANEVAARKRVEDYANAVENDLNGELYTDFAGYMRAIQAKTSHSEVLYGTYNAAEYIAAEFKKIQNIGTASPTS